MTSSNTIHSKVQRKMKLNEAAKSQTISDTTMDSHIKKIKNNLNKLGNQLNSLNEVSIPLNKGSMEVGQQGDSLKNSQQNEKHFKSESRRRKKLYENKRKSVSKRFLRQHANELKRQRDFNNFLTQHDIGTINEIDSISSSESSIFHSKMNSSMIKKDRYQVYPFNNMKEFDMNKAFQLQNPKQLEKRNTSKYFLSSLRSELNVKCNKNQIFKSCDFSQEFCSDKPDYSYTPCNASSIKSEILRISGIVNQNSRNISVINLSIQERKLFKMFKSS